MSTTRRTQIAIAIGLIVGLVASGHAAAEQQNDAIGFSPQHVFSGALDGESVDVLTGNVNIRIPLGPRYSLNDWFGYQVVLYYNSKIWENECSPLDATECPGELVGSETYGQGFQIHFGRIWHHPKDKDTVYRYQTPDGADHFFCTDIADLECGPLNGFFYTVDSSSIEIRMLSPTNWEALPGDGTRVKLDHCLPDDDSRENGEGCYATRIETIATDPLSGSPPQPQHYVDITYAAANSDSIAEITDSASRTISFGTVSGGKSITLPAVNGSTPTTATYTLLMSQRVIRDPWIRLGTPTPGDSTRTRWMLTNVTIPALVASEKYTFSYTPQSTETDFGFLSQWTVPTGATTKYWYTQYKTSQRKPWNSTMTLRELTANGQTHRWTYNRFGDGACATSACVIASMLGSHPIARSNPTRVEVLDPFDNLTVYTFLATTFVSPNNCVGNECPSSWFDGLLNQVETFAGPAESGDRLVRRAAYRYTYDDVIQTRTAALQSAFSVARNVRVEEVETVTPGHGVQPASVHRVVYGRPEGVPDDGWTPASGFIRRPRVTREYKGNELYLETLQEWYPTPQFHDYVLVTELRNASGEAQEKTHTVFDGNRLVCAISRLDPGVDPLNQVLPATCPATAGDLPPGSGDVASVHAYDPSTGNPTGTKILGGDDGSAFETTFEYVNGVLSDKKYAPFEWSALHRTTDPKTGLVMSSRDPNLLVTAYTWDSLGRLLSVDPPGGVEAPVTVQYANVKETHVRQTVGTETTESVFFYDDLGRVIEEQRTNAIGGKDFRKTEWDIAGRTTQQSEWAQRPSGAPPGMTNVPASTLAWTVYDYGTLSNPNAGLPGERDRFTDPLGRIAEVTRPDGSVTETRYDGLATTVITRGINGLAGVLDSATTYINDVFGRLIGVDSPETYPGPVPGDGADAVYTYDERDDLVQVDLTDPTNTTRVQRRYFEYDALGNLRFATNPENGTVSYLSYDAGGRLLHHRDTASREFINTYDEAGRLVLQQGKICPMPSCLSNPALTLLANTYDVGNAGFDSGAAAGKLTQQKSYRDDSGQSALVSTRNYRYGMGGAPCPLTEVSTDALLGLNGRLELVTTQIEPWDQNLETRYCYNARGLPAAVLYPDEYSNRTTAQVTWSYVNGQLSSVRDVARQIDHAFGIQYDAHGAVTAIERLSGVRTTIARDVQGRPLQFDVTREVWMSGGGGGGGGGGEPCGPGGPGNVVPQECGGGGGGGGGGEPWLSVQSLWQYGPYSYDGVGNIAQIGQDTFAYDELNRLVASSILNDGVTFGDSWTYDAFGNMVDTTRSVIGSSAYPSQTSHAFSLEWQRNQLLSQGSILYDHDPAGNLIRDGEHWNVFDERNRLVEVWDESTGGPQARVAQYDYDASGYRVRSLVQGIETYFLRNEAGQVLSEFRRAEDGTSQAGWDKDYVYGLGQALALVKNEAPGPIGRLRVASKTSSSVTLEWDPSDDTDFKWYCVERRTMPESGGYHYQCQVFGTTWQDTYPAGKTGIYYLVRAVDWADNEGPWSAELVFHPNDTTAPPVPVLLAAEGLDRAVRVRWQAITGVDDLAGFMVERSVGPNNYQSITPTLVQGSEFIDVGLTNGTFYRYRVRSVDTSNNPSAPSNWKPATASDGTPPAPHGLVARPGFVPGTIELSWTPILGATSYDTVRRVCPNGVGGSTPDNDDTDTEATDVNVPVGQDWCYYVQSCEGQCLPTLQFYGPVVARARSFVPGAPTAIQADFEVLCPGGSQPPCSPPSDPRNVIYELFQQIGVRVSWTAIGDPAIVGFRIYRAPGTTAEFVRVADVAEPVRTFFDTGIGDWKYTYQVVAVLADGNEAVGCSSGCTGALAEDEYPDDAVVRNLVAYDSSGDSEVENEASRAVRIEWSRVLESQLVGYHVYRRCAWDFCDAHSPGSSYSMDTLECGDAWVRLTDVPITASEEFTDTTTGGLGGCFLYAVQPVGPGGQLGDFQKILSVDTYFADTVQPQYQQQEQFLDWTASPQVRSHALEIARLNAASRGNGAPGGPADPPTMPPSPPGADTDPKQYPWVGTLAWEYPTTSVSLQLRFTQAPASDLKGYHVEMAGSFNGPWQRVTQHPVAWWETEYSLRGLGACTLGSGCLGDTSFYGSHDCAHVRLIAVDEEGNESPPAYPEYVTTPPNTAFSRPGCSTLPTPAAPDGLTASEAQQAGCNVQLTWNQVPEAVSAPAEYEYNVYRLTFDLPSRYFYRTQVVQATSCVGNVCSHVENGDSGTSRAADSNLDCPYGHDLACQSSGTQAFYVTVRRKAVGAEPHGGESPRSQVVIWDCTLGDVSRAEPVEEDAVYFASVGPSREEGEVRMVANPVVELAVCETEAEYGDVVVAQSLQPLDAEPALAPLLFLGQVPPPLESPGYRVIDLHVDHLGSVRLTTDELGQVTARHDFLPFGEEINPIVPSPDASTKMFTGHERDSETGMDYMMARYYAPGSSRFASRDLVAGVVSRPQSWNSYTYVLNQPVDLRDPTGLSWAPGTGPPKQRSVPQEPGRPWTGIGRVSCLMCHDFVGGTEEEREQAYADQERLRLSLTPGVKKWFKYFFGVDIDEVLRKGKGVIINLDEAPPNKGGLGQVTPDGKIYIDMNQLVSSELFQANLLHETAHWATLKEFGSIRGPQEIVWPGLKDAVANQANSGPLVLHLIYDGYIGLATEQIQFGRVVTWSY